MLFLVMMILTSSVLVDGEGKCGGQGGGRCMYESDEEVDEDDFDDTYKIINNVKISSPLEARMKIKAAKLQR